MKRIISGRSLGDLIKWYEGRTSSTHNGNSSYERTIDALQELSYRRRWPEAPIVEKQVAIEEEEDPLPILNERQILVLYVVGEGRFDLLDASKAANVKTIDQLVELGVLNDWRQLTDLGSNVLKEAKR